MARYKPKTVPVPAIYLPVQSACNAFDRIVRTYGPYLRAILVRRGVCDCDADDVLQEVWATFGLHADRLSGDPRPWLVHVAINYARNYYQQRKTAEKYPIIAFDDDAPNPNPAPDAEQWVIAGQTARLVNTLDSTLRAVVTACMAGETIEEMSERLRIAEGTCSSRLRRARIRLKAALKVHPASHRF